MGKIPYNEEAEKTVLGGILLKPSSLDEVLEILEVEDFYRPNHKTLYFAMLGLHREGKPVDLLGITTRLKELEAMQEIGGFEQLVDLSGALERNAVSASNIGYYAKEVKAKSQLRQLIKSCHTAVESAEALRDSAEICAELESELYSIKSNDKRETVYNSDQIAQLVIRAAENRQRGVVGIRTGFPDLDRILVNGIRPTDYVIIAARPSQGKTSLGLRLMLNMARAGSHCAFYSIEMSPEILAERMTGMISGRAFHLVSQASDVVKHAHFLSGLPIDICDPRNELDIILSHIRASVRLRGVEVVFIDYLQTIAIQGVKEIYQRVTLASGELKKLAKELNIPIVCLCQINRESVKNGLARRPTLSDLKGSGDIEQDADMVVAIYNEIDKSELVVLKHRNGPVGASPVSFHRETSDFKPVSSRSSVVPPATYDELSFDGAM